MSIVLKNISKKYNLHTSNECTVLNDISLQIQDGQMIAIKGKSGAGKSTLLHIIGCLDTATAGEYYLDGENISKYNDKSIAYIRNKMFGFVMQDFGLINDDTVTFNVCLPLLLGTRMKGNKKYLAEAKLEEMGIADLKDRLVEGLSGGEKQRVAIARALVNNPKYILADEPTGSLDTANANKIMDILENLHQQGKTVIIVTHDHDVAARCEKTYVISDGRCISET